MSDAASVPCPPSDLPRRIELARGTYYYVAAARVLWDERSAHPTMTWPLPLADEVHSRVHALALETADPAMRQALFAVLSVASAYAQMTLDDPRSKRDHVCAMLRAALRAKRATASETSESSAST